MRKTLLPLEISDSRVDMFIKILHKTRHKASQKLHLQIQKKTKITPAGYAILEAIKENCAEHKSSLKITPEPNAPTNMLFKNLGPGIWPQLGVEVDKIFNFLDEEKKFRIKMILNELMQNAADHSGSEKYILYAGLSENEIHLGCLDRGVSVPAKLTQKYDCADDIKFIEHSLVQGVTTRRVRIGGLGLTHVFDYAKLEKGRLVIISRNAQYRKYFKTRKSQKQKLKHTLQGTWVMVRFALNEKN